MKHILFAAFAAIMLAGCSRTLEQQVKMASGHCPVTIDNVGFIKEITLQGDTLLYDCAVTNATIDLPALSTRMDNVRRVMAAQLPALFAKNTELLEAVLDAGLTLSVRYTDTSGRSMRVDFPAPELRRITTPGKTAASSTPEQRLADEIAISRASLPAEMASGIMITDIVDRGDMLVFECTVDEAVAGNDAIKRLRANRDAISSEMRQTLTSRASHDINTLVSITTAAGRGIAYRYTGSDSRDTMTVSFTPRDLAATQSGNHVID